MLTLKDLEGIKLVSDETYIAPVSDAQTALERVFQQASQGWGIRREDGVLLRMASDIKIALALAESADENGRLLKGAQMELGRVKKQRDVIQADLDVARTQLEVLQKALDKPA
jgi:hypothetical protein